ncbi:Unknown protein [Striga hermonthica]|uniref:Uncharacterized protein n=1 Tax=Striga hermonthica TaxID=68872 RepID=A0A9N7MLH0_STRHE|nr:Unknown protein [Striga hermonthica]
MDDDDTPEHSAAIHESDKATSHIDTTTAFMVLPKVGPSENLVSAKPVQLEDCTGSDDGKDISSDSHFRNEPTGDPSSEEHDDTNSTSTNTTSSNGKEDFDHVSINSSSCHYKYAIPVNSHLLHTVEIAEENTGKKNEVGVEDHVMNNRERVAVDVHLQPSLVEQKREGVGSTQGDTRVAPLPLQYSKLVKTQLKEFPKIQKQESYVALKVPSVERLENGKKLNDSSSALGKDTETTIEKSMKDTDALRSLGSSFSLEVNKYAAQKGGNPISLAAIRLSNKQIPAEGHNKLFSIERGRKTPELPGVKLRW